MLAQHDGLSIGELVAQVVLQMVIVGTHFSRLEVVSPTRLAKVDLLGLRHNIILRCCIAKSTEKRHEFV